MNAMWLQENAAIRLTAYVLLAAACLLVTVAHFVMEPLRWNRCYLSTASTFDRRHVRDALFCTALATYLLPFKLGIPLRVVLLRRQGRLTLHFIGIVVALDGILSFRRMVLSDRLEPLAGSVALASARLRLGYRSRGGGGWLGLVLVAATHASALVAAPARGTCFTGSPLASNHERMDSPPV